MVCIDSPVFKSTRSPVLVPLKLCMPSDSPLFSEPLGRLCLCPDAQKKIGGLSPISQDIITLTLANNDHWIKLGQIIKTCKPIVDAIGNIESRDCNLADCMLELIQCARHMH